MSGDAGVGRRAFGVRDRVDGRARFRVVERARACVGTSRRGRARAVATMTDGWRMKVLDGFATNPRGRVDGGVFAGRPGRERAARDAMRCDANER